MEESEIKKSSAVRDAVLCLFLSTLMRELGGSSFFFAAPLMIYAIKHGRKKALTLFFAEALIVLMMGLFVQKGFSDQLSLVVFLLGLVIPMSLLAAGAIWLFSDKHSLAVRIFLSLIPVIVLSGAFAVFFTVDRTLFDSLYDFYRNAFASSLGEIFGKLFAGIDNDVVFAALFSSFLSVILPVFTLAVCATSFVYETGLHSREDNWEDRVQGFEFHSDFVWFFIVSLALLLICYFVSTVPLWLMVLIMNAAGVFTILYAIQGFSVIYSFFRKRMRTLKSMTLFIVLFIMALVVPGINFIIIFGTPLIGLLESFFDLKKLGVRNEDYS